VKRDESDSGYIVPKHLRFARSLALVSGVAIGVAAGATVFTSVGCDNPEIHVCNGFCTESKTKPFLGTSRELLLTGTIAPAATLQSAPSDPVDGSVDSVLPVDGSVGGGPLPAPPLPRVWFA
jgi:hypothetical protein